MRMLKCPHCRRQMAWLEYGYNEKLDKRYRQKHCGCGYAGARHYFSLTETERRDLNAKTKS